MDSPIVVKDINDDSWVEVSKTKVNKVKVVTPNSKKPKQQQNKTQNKSQNCLTVKKSNATNKQETRKRSDSEHSKSSDTFISVITDGQHNQVANFEYPTNKPNPWSNVESVSLLKTAEEDQIDPVSSLGLSLNQLSIVEHRVQLSVKPDEFFGMCQNFDINSCELMSFHVRWVDLYFWINFATLQFQLRGLVNTGCACFRNCIIQALLSLKPFVRFDLSGFFYWSLNTSIVIV